MALDKLDIEDLSLLSTIVAKDAKILLIRAEKLFLVSNHVPLKVGVYWENSSLPCICFKSELLSSAPVRFKSISA